MKIFDSYNVTPEELFDLFGKFGPIRQVRQGIATATKGTAFVVYEDVIDAKQACDKLNGFNFQNRYLVVLYHQPDKMAKSKEDLEARRESLARLKQQHGRSTPSPKTTPRAVLSDPKTIPRSAAPATKSTQPESISPRTVRFVENMRRPVAAHA
ncbi:pre-mRNA branch site protein p14 [Cordyceps fumosorosea ARSEF 2679]|uniref:Pre-mRNA branch site protein p14 n=1 Tax=Cordyceps fumosorosea (strain ARSEF 2679) TaxID=1081104 RepID=A0A168E0Z5_CORFA|nr:pre-mRNA branch site protein p14 [Cordyceps fumosorosea ARSEF 2679]OAA73248.1 pre-mRNA branch site protein p14 [Cordyceps fumosorosea ARSEF 2679]